MLNLILGICASLIAAVIYSHLPEIHWRTIGRKLFRKTKEITFYVIVTLVITTYPLKRTTQQFKPQLLVALFLISLITGILFITIPQKPLRNNPEDLARAERNNPEHLARAEYRAFWVDTLNTSLNGRANVLAVVNRAREADANAIFLRVRRCGDSLCLDPLEPRGDHTPIQPGFDPLKEFINEAHAQGIEVHAFVSPATNYPLDGVHIDRASATPKSASPDRRPRRTRTLATTRRALNVSRLTTTSGWADLFLVIHNRVIT